MENCRRKLQVDVVGWIINASSKSTVILMCWHFPVNLIKLLERRDVRFNHWKTDCRTNHRRLCLDILTILRLFSRWHFSFFRLFRQFALRTEKNVFFVFPRIQDWFFLSLCVRSLHLRQFFFTIVIQLKLFDDINDSFVVSNSYCFHNSQLVFDYFPAQYFCLEIQTQRWKTCCTIITTGSTSNSRRMQRRKK